MRPFSIGLLRTSKAMPAPPPPLQLPGVPVTILDASAPSTLSLSGANVLSWTSTGSDVSTYSAPGAYPQFSGSGITSAVETSSTSGHRYLRGGPLSTPAWHMFAVISPSGANSVTPISDAYANDTVYAFAQYGGIRIRNDSGTIRAVGHVFDGGHKGVQSTAVLSVNTKVIVDVSVGSSTLGVRVNGANQSTTACGTTVSSFGWQTGIGNVSFSDTFYGKIYEIVVYSSQLTGVDYTQAIEALTEKWAV